ncbi:MAG: hypothetical protein IT434_03180 [Phycisphaerales bacterium]|jgi:hypothetical protein|nr:hypothetical protein [Phycisphaerales bacterium]
MASGRSNKPLFELLREDTGAGMFGRRASATFSELKPGETGRARSAYVTVPRTWVYFGVAIVLGLIAGAWVIAYRSGHGAAEKELAGSLVGGTRTDQPKVNEPENPAKLAEKPIGVTPTAPKDGGRPTGAQPPKPEPKNEPKAESKPESRPETKPKPEAPKPEAGRKAEEGVLITLPVDDPGKPVLTSKGAVDADPRQPGMNYMVLVGGLPRDEARTMIAYLSANGLEAVGVPMNVVDRAGRVVNNQPLFKVVCVGGISRQQFRDKDSARTNLEQAAAGLNERWLRDTKSRWSFAKTYWELLQGP